MLKKENITFEYMDGSTKNRQKVIDNFNNNNNIRTFLISLKTGGYGLNLTSADTVIIVDPWWNPMGENQAIDRAHRIGQTKKVMVYKIITKGTIEEKILDLQQNKKVMFENIIEEGQSVVKKMDAEQLRELLEY
jgi:SNF2 family DNA or RNA helicase